MPEYKPRSKNKRVDSRNSWSSSFEKLLENKRDEKAPCGFQEDRAR